jgi:amino acid transporter
MYTVSRMLYAEATEGILPRSLGHLSNRRIPVRCLIFAFAVIGVCISFCWLADVKVASLILLVNQNFLFLFLVSIWAYGRAENSSLRWIVVAAALTTCCLFLSGFSAWIGFPLALIGIGTAIGYRVPGLGIGAKPIGSE